MRPPDPKAAEAAHLRAERERARLLLRLEKAAEAGNVVAMLALHRIYSEGVTWH